MSDEKQTLETVKVRDSFARLELEMSQRPEWWDRFVIDMSAAGARIVWVTPYGDVDWEGPITCAREVKRVIASYSDPNTTRPTGAPGREGRALAHLLRESRTPTKEIPRETLDALLVETRKDVRP